MSQRYPVNNRHSIKKTFSYGDECASQRLCKKSNTPLSTKPKNNFNPKTVLDHTDLRNVSSQSSRSATKDHINLAPLQAFSQPSNYSNVRRELSNANSSVDVLKNDLSVGAKNITTNNTNEIIAFNNGLLTQNDNLTSTMIETDKENGRQT